MKKIFLTVAMIAVSLSSTIAQGAVSEKFKVYDLDNSKLHMYQSGDPMGNVSYIIEGQKGLVLLEQPLFWESINEYTAYIESLDKPIEKVVANYHSLGLANYKSSSVVMPEGMIAFTKSEAFGGMSAKFATGFGEAADMRPHTKAKGFKVPSSQKWAGVEMEFTPGVASDFPAASILIDGKAYYTHFTPSKAHFTAMQIKSRESIDFILAELCHIKSSGVEYIFGSHGADATMAEVEFQIEYLNSVKSILSSSADSDIFTQRLIVAYPTLDGAEGVSTFAKGLYPEEVISDDKLAIKERIQDYFNMVSNLDQSIADDLWADRDDISIITPRSQFFGKESIMDDFLLKTFSKMSYRKLSSYSEVVNIYGDSANVQLYWKFDTKDADGVAHQTQGRETLVFSRIDNKWCLVHVHYSRMPQ